MRPPDHGKLDALVSEMSEQVASQLQIVEELKKTVGFSFFLSCQPCAEHCVYDRLQYQGLTGR